MSKISAFKLALQFMVYDYNLLSQLLLWYVWKIKCNKSFNKIVTGNNNQCQLLRNSTSESSTIIHKVWKFGFPGCYSLISNSLVTSKSGPGRTALQVRALVPLQRTRIWLSASTAGGLTTICNSNCRFLSCFLILI